MFTEDQNASRLQGKFATLAGKPDLIAVKGSDMVVIGTKMDRLNPATSAQVMMYMYAVPRALEQCRRAEFRGHVIHPDGNVQVPTSGVDGKFVDKIGSLVRRLADETPARRFPAVRNAGGATSPLLSALIESRTNQGRKGRPKTSDGRQDNDLGNLGILGAIGHGDCHKVCGPAKTFTAAG